MTTNQAALTVLPFASREHPALASARQAIVRNLRQMSPAEIFHIAALTDILLTGRDDARWSLSADYAHDHPAKFRRPRKER